jgi:ribokinase
VDVMSRFKVIGFGQCSLDILGQVGQYPELDQKVELGSFLVQGGGPVATAMVTLARLGVDSSFIGAVGSDDFGQKIRQGLLDENVDCSFLQEVDNASSQVAFIAVDENGHRNIFWHRGEANPVVPYEMESLLSGGVEVLHLDGLHLQPAVCAAEMARDKGVLTVLDAGTFRAGMEELLPLIDHLVVSEKFARQATGEKAIAKALVLLARFGAQAVTITAGKDGSVSLEKGGEPVFQPIFHVDVVDTTGCGDVFHGGYIYGLLQGWALQHRVRFAAACAALKAKRLGGRTAIPCLAEVEVLLSSGVHG